MAHYLDYDIPNGAYILNPSFRLRRIGFRSTLSVWVIPDDRIPWNLLNEMSAVGCTWNLIKFDVSEGEKLLKMAVASLQRDVKEIVASVQKSLDSAAKKRDGKVTEALTKEDADKAHKAYERRVRAVTRMAEKLLKASESAANAFNIDTTGLPITEARNSVGAMKAAAETRAMVVSALTAAVQGTMFEAAAAADEVPPMILADMADDSGANEVAEMARAAFGS